MIMSKFMFAVALLAAGSIPLLAQDAEGCKDYPMFSRMPNYFINECNDKEFDFYVFFCGYKDDGAVNTRVEGHHTHVIYTLKEGSKAPSALQIVRNYEHALKQIHAEILYVDNAPDGSGGNQVLTAVIKRNSNQVWFNLVGVQEAGDTYTIEIIEQEAMKQEVVANDILKSLNQDGHVALNILFDTGKSTIKPESQSIVDEIYKMLSDNIDIRVSIEGHTDNVGNPPKNKKLSEDRANAVMNALIAKGVSKSRLSSAGWGQEKPVADNGTDEGKAKNRRVEIVKK